MFLGRDATCSNDELVCIMLIGLGTTTLVLHKVPGFTMLSLLGSWPLHESLLRREVQGGEYGNALQANQSGNTGG